MPITEKQLDLINKIVGDGKDLYTQTVDEMPSYFWDISFEAFKITIGLVSIVAAGYFQINTFDQDWVKSGFYYQIRSGMLDQLIAGVVCGLSIPLLISGVKRVLCCNGNSKDVRIAQTVTTLLSSLAIASLGVSLTLNAFRKIDMAIQLHEANQTTVCQNISQGWFSVFDVARRYFFSK